MLRTLALCVSVVLIALYTPTSGESSQSYPITTLINAKWTQTPLYLEIAEYLADEQSGLFWDYVSGVTKLDTVLNEYDTESQQYNAALELVKSHVSSPQLPLLKLVVSMHSLTPRIQTHFQLAEELRSSGSCQSYTFAQVGSELACSFNELQKKLELPRAKESLDAPVVTYSFDHIFPGSENNTRTVILYGDLGSSQFRIYHKLLEKEANAGRIRYILRHQLAKTDRRPVRLSGYGVELHLKSTEYKSQDDAPKPEAGSTSHEDLANESDVQGFDFKVLKQKHPTLKRALDQLRQRLLQGNDEIAQLKAWEFQDLGLQAAAAIAEIQGDETLQILQYTAHNFPMLARTLLAHKVTDGLRAEVKHNTEAFGRSLNVAPPDGALFINGLFFDADTMDLYSLIETLRSEMRVLESLHSNNVRGSLASSLLALDLTASSKKEFAIDIRDTAVQWVNDIENDAQYRRWPSSVMDLLRPTFPGMLRNIRKNVFNLVLVVDALQPTARSVIKLSESFVIHQAPIRLGLVFDARDANEDNLADYVAITCAYNYVSQKKDARAALSFLTDIYAAVGETKVVSKKDIVKQLTKEFTTLSFAKAEEFLEEDSTYDYGRELATEFIQRLGFGDKGQPQALLNGVPMPSNVVTADSDFEEAIFTEIMTHTSNLQKAVYKGEMTDSDVAIDYLMNQPHVMPRLNQRILSQEDVKYLDINGVAYKNLGNVGVLNRLSNRDMTATLMDNLKYFGGKKSTELIGRSSLQFLTIWVFADLETDQGRELLTHALEYVQSGESVRVAFIPNTESSSASSQRNLNRLVWAAMQSLPPTQATEQVLKWLKKPKEKIEIPSQLEDILGSTELHLKMLRVYSQRVLGLNKSQRLVIGNGRLYGPLSSDESFDSADFALLARFSSLQYGDKVRQVLKESAQDVSEEFTSDTLLKLYASLLPRQTKTRFKLPTDLKTDHSVVKLPPKQEKLPHFDVTAVLDPASRAAQKLTPILILLRQVLNCQLNLYLIPVPQHSDMPVKNFYRYVVEPEVQFEVNGGRSDGPLAKFSGLPANPLLTQQLQVPENWLIEAVRAVYDLDNIKLTDIGGPVHSEFDLEYLLLEGHCFDAASGAPPRGLQLVLGTQSQPTLVDTIVMANLGYFQLKANPGAWSLRLREGKSADIYAISHIEGTNTHHSAGSSEVQVLITSLRSHVVKLRVSKKPGMQQAELLSDDNEQAAQSGIWNSIASSFGGSNANQPAPDEDAETINIFSVASGHLYERLLRIMMVSLLKHTKSPVKFWFLKNYLSPQFTDFLPHMASEYNFQYELVQYKWPRWLHQQTEKQRTIWGYKILFLDVLFPLNVRKIIFVDADAIVRTDIKELYDMDLGGAPYAYTPFCDSRKEMEGFRFWKQGYWRSHLMGRRYHISALYVVDLKRFRKIAAGDRLRGQYQALSQDPNSLSNLDQDLPNNMIHQVAIKSLPDDWLWCQTWCSDSNFKSAKVIDLCNNPQTKEAKLTAAQRIVPEWKDYDAELKTLMSRIEDHENSHGRDSAVDDSGDDLVEATTVTPSHEPKHGEL
ncbi:UDP-glucose:glycoprotein glucosyltransferase [Drosophila teissieri]|uniref:UDP-glucose:glycoprotein glucosyltransferase n=1 Tax=Drosophila teissieri TaxID=7243 RepID=UPI001CB9F7F6|nr:UDP-glucose:glycoprotein glucosyltransferase [Drosophila teissieri]XP_043661714.1 UDP-glucose:glycoprotein glucosyltransferase [Drosophila teissieri]